MNKSDGERRAQPSPASKGLRPQVLVVDDNDVNRKVIMAMLTKLGVDSIEASGGHEALVWYKNEPFDGIFMDWHMPDMDGLAATGEIRRMEARAAEGNHMPVIAVTASALVGDREQCLEAGMDDYLSKPTTLEGLQEMIDKWITPNRPEPPTAAAPAAGATFDDSIATALGRLATELGDESIVHMLIDTFMDELPKWQTSLATAKETGNVEEMALAAHTTKSAARSLGLDTLADRCQELETAGRATDSTVDQSALSDLAGSVLEAMDASASQLTAYKNSRAALTT